MYNTICNNLSMTFLSGAGHMIMVLGKKNNLTAT